MPSMPSSQSVVGVLWSAVATIESTRHGLRPGELQAFVGLRAGHFVHQVAVDVEQRGAVVLDVHDVAVPELVVERLTHVPTSCRKNHGIIPYKGLRAFAGSASCGLPFAAW